jgi:hypothetical protein
MYLFQQLFKARMTSQWVPGGAELQFSIFRR